MPRPSTRAGCADPFDNPHFNSASHFKKSRSRPLSCQLIGLRSACSTVPSLNICGPSIGHSIYYRCSWHFADLAVMLMVCVPMHSHCVRARGNRTIRRCRLGKHRTPRFRVYPLLRRKLGSPSLHLQRALHVVIHHRLPYSCRELAGAPEFQK